MENAYTAMPWTTWVGRTMFAGENPISGNLFEKESIGEKEGEYPLYDYLKNHGYHVYHSCTSARGVSMFAGEHLCEVDMVNYSFGMSTRYQWLGICKLLKNKGKNFIILHNLSEAHAPYASMDMNFYDWRSHGRIAEELKTVNRRFLDDRIKWYSRFYGERTIRVWMSDHGDGYINEDIKKCKWTRLDSFQEEKTHVILGVSGQGVKNICEKRYFQFDGFASLIKYLIEKNEADYEEMFKPYVMYEDYAQYGKRNIDHISAEELLRTKSTWQQFLGIRDDKYLYILYYDGSESFYALPDEKTDEIENPAYAETLAKYRALVDGKKFINIFEKEKFVHSRKLYEKIGVTKHIW
jgi:hypothetical protein